MKRSFAAAALALGLAGVFPSLPARAADTEAWLWMEGRVPLARRTFAEAGRIDLRVYGELDADTRSKGVNFAQARVGPLFFLTDWLYIAPQASVAGNRLGDGTWQQQAWLELEPNFFGAIGDFVILDRHRGEYRYREDARDYWVYRNLLKISYAPAGASWIPFVSDEIWINATLGQLTENRASIGIGYLLAPSTRVDLAYMFRSSKSTAWVNDHVLTLFFFFDAPPPPVTPATPPSAPPPSAPSPVHVAPPPPAPAPAPNAPTKPSAPGTATPAEDGG